MLMSPSHPRKLLTITVTIAIQAMIVGIVAAMIVVVEIVEVVLAVIVVAPATSRRLPVAPPLCLHLLLQDIGML